MDRDLSQDFKTQIKRGVYLPVTVLPQGSGTPLLGEGDAAGSYFSISRVAAGNYLLSTKNPLVAVIDKRATVRGGYKVQLGPATQNTDRTWSIPIYTASDLRSVVSVGSITAGTGYSNSFPVTFTGGGGVGAKGTATASGGAIASVAITDGGFGYTSAPTPVFTAGGGSSGAATAVLGTDAAVDIPIGVGIHVFLLFRNSNQVP